MHSQLNQRQLHPCTFDIQKINADNFCDDQIGQRLYQLTSKWVYTIKKWDKRLGKVGTPQLLYRPNNWRTLEYENFASNCTCTHYCMFYFRVLKNTNRHCLCCILCTYKILSQNITICDIVCTCTSCAVCLYFVSLFLYSMCLSLLHV
jgi:hypothetical protein